MKMIALVVAALVLTSSCSPPIRYQRADLANGSAPDLRRCQYETWKADRWGDNDFLDRCMEKYGYFVDRERSTAFWWPGMKDTFAEIEARTEKAPGRERTGTK